jgi:hypothetical protein
VVQADLGRKQDPISKITNAKRAGGVAQVVELLPSKCKALNSSPSIHTHTHTHKAVSWRISVQSCFFTTWGWGSS